MKITASRRRCKAALAFIDLLLLGVIAACGGAGGNGNNTGTPPATSGTEEFLYVSDTIGNLFGFFIDANSGALSFIRSGRPMSVVGVGATGIGNVVRVVADPSGSALYASRANVAGGANVLVLLPFPDNTKPGELIQGPTQTLFIPPGKLAVDQSDKNLYVIPDPSANLPEIISFTIAPGTHILQELSPTPLTAVPGVPHDITVDPFGHYVYVTFAGAPDAQVAGYSRDQTTGALTNLPNSPFANTGGNNSQGLSITPSGSFAVVANAATNNLSVMSLNATTGTLTNVAGSPFHAGASPLAAAIDPSGKFVFVVNEGANTFSAYTMSAAGELTAITGSPFTVGSRPQSVTVDPSGKFVYVATPDGSVWGFSLNTGTASLTPITGSPFHLNSTADSTTGFCVPCGAELRDIVVLKP